MRIVMAEEGDVARVLEIEQESFSPPWAHGSLLRELYSDESFFAVAAEENSIHGFVILRRVADEGELFQIAVDSNARRRGAADMLMRAALRYAGERAIRKIYLEVRGSNAPAIALYRKHGFAPVGRRKRYFDNPVEDAVIMIREFG